MATPFVGTTPFSSDPLENLANMATRSVNTNLRAEQNALEQAIARQKLLEEQRQFNITSGQTAFNNQQSNILSNLPPDIVAQLLPNLQGINNVVQPGATNPIADLQAELAQLDKTQSQANVAQTQAQARETGANIGDDITFEDGLAQVARGGRAEGPLRVQVAQEQAKAQQQVKPTGTEFTERLVITNDPQSPIEKIKTTRDIFDGQPSGDVAAPTVEVIDGLELPAGVSASGKSKEFTLGDGRIFKMIPSKHNGVDVLAIYDDEGQFVELRDAKDSKKVINIGE